VTACAQQRACVFGAVVDEAVVLSAVGMSANVCLTSIPQHHQGVQLDAYGVMPNHVHAVIEIQEGRASLGVIVGTFKAAVTRSTGRPGLWQRGFYEHVVRDDADLARIREYIATNPVRWALDPENPASPGL
jgi:REP element-mobilizing transposase RayT